MLTATDITGLMALPPTPTRPGSDPFGGESTVDIDEAVEMFPDQEDLLRSLASGDSDLTTNADRDYKWVIAASHRLRLVEPHVGTR